MTNTLRRTTSLIAAVSLSVVLLAAGAAGQESDGVRPSGGEDVLAVVGGDVYTGTGVVLRRGTVICRDGKIAAVGVDLDIPEGARIVDATDRRVLPGFVAPHGGNFGILRGRPQSGEKFRDCLDPESLYAELALSAGITSYFGQGGGRRRGTYTDSNAIVKPAYGAPELMIVKEPAALTVTWGRQSASERQSFRQTLQKVRKWIDAGGKGKPPAPPSVVAAMKRELPVRITASTRREIRHAIELAEDFQLELVLVHAMEAWTMPEDVASSGAIAIVRPRVRRWPTTGEEGRSGSTIENAAILERAGAKFCILPPSGRFGGGERISLGGIVGRDMLTYSVEGAFAIRGGASPDATLRAITLTAAEALGIEDRVGSLAAGKDADIVVYQGDPFDYRMMAEVTIVSGRVLYERTKSTLFSHLPDR